MNRVQRPPLDWPPVSFETRVWDWRGERPRYRADRLFSRYESAIPPEIAQVDLELDMATVTALDTATAAIVRLDADPNSRLAGVAGALLRSESVGSSKIEHLEVDARGLALAALGETKARAAASQVWANVMAMERALEIAEAGELRDDVFTRIHLALMEHDPAEAEWAGTVRAVQNWIGGSDECPRDALFVPPATERVESLLGDLARFCRRDDVPPLAQAAIGHAQFETIHPFTDGNGRTGRALIHTVLRRRRLTQRVVVPTSSALLADVDGYFDALDDYRRGHANAYLRFVARASERAADEARLLGSELDLVATEWRNRVRPRAGSVGEQLIDALIRQPVMTASNHGATGPDRVTLYRTIDRLVGSGVLTEITKSARNRVWVATDVTAALDEFARRIGRRQDAR